LTFDVWTFRQNDAYLGIHAYFVDTDWNPRTTLLGLQPFHGKQHNGSEIADMVAYVLKFFEVEKR
jgi:hypothetical protein